MSRLVDSCLSACFCCRRKCEVDLDVQWTWSYVGDADPAMERGIAILCRDHLFPTTLLNLNLNVVINKFSSNHS